MNITVAWEDVVSVVTQISIYLTVIGAGLLAMIIILITAGRHGKPKSGFVRKQSVLGFLLITAVTVNMILTGPMSSLISAATVKMGDLREETVQSSREIIEDIANEGIVLTKNEGQALPLQERKLNVFGWASTNPIYGGTGSGTVDASTAVSLLAGLEHAGFELNNRLSDMYIQYRSDRPIVSINDGQEWTLPEIPAGEYGQDVLDEAKSFSDTAVIVLARSGGEGADLPHDMGAVMDGSWSEPGTKYLRASYRNNSESYEDYTAGQTYLELSRTEQKLVELVCGNFDEVIVIYNGSNPMEMGWTDEYEQIKGVLLCPAAGATGFNALGNILAGDVNPSGKTTDTWVKDLTAAPYYNNIGHFAYTNVEEVTAKAREVWPNADGIVSFVNYVEGIYVGYRFYETAAEEGLFLYEDEVQYPFGYGLSYTGFTREMGTMQEADGILTVDITVTNTGSVAGKDVAELYYTPPYTNGGIEKSSVNLAAFGKTDLLEPGQSQTLTLTFALEDMASYDDQGEGCYVLEAGNYRISLRTDSHHAVAEQEYTVAETVVYHEGNPRSTDRETAVNRMDTARGELTYLSRANGFANYGEATAAPSDHEVNGVVEAHGTYDPAAHNYPEDEMPVTGARNGLALNDLRGVDYDDPRWEQLLDQLDVEDMVDLIGYGGFQTVSLDSAGKISTMDTDGPAGVNYFLTSSFGTGYCSEMLLAQTWNTELAYRAGDGICQELNDFGFDGWYGPSMNLHRSAFGGRDFEYYSEDGVLSAQMAAAEVQAAYDHNIYPYLKHFILNEQEINRNGLLCTWFTEQSFRELYAKPFEVCVKLDDNAALAVMSSYNFLGTTWAAESRDLLYGILRGEWGFRGMVLSDYFGNYGYMDADRAVRGGTDIMLGTAGNDAIMTDLSATSVIAMRQAAKNVFYTVVNSGAYENYTAGQIPDWMKILYGVDAALAAVWIGMEILSVRGYQRRRKQAASIPVETAE